ncbi:unnamed protein product [Callosobruchus maculatus]|uniref:Uncharacterized protein n=1 Tax=Callosobruchus maculatus TaxID=64391 RepID=A0A653DWI7_CALMS|nr:unnamed protein product [Callosobruchus maculatus]
MVHMSTTLKLLKISVLLLKIIVRRLVCLILSQLRWTPKDQRSEQGCLKGYV